MSDETSLWTFACVSYTVFLNRPLSRKMCLVQYSINCSEAVNNYPDRRYYFISDISFIDSVLITDPDAYYYTTGTLNGLHERERFEDGTKRFENETFRGQNETFQNGTLWIFGNGTLCTLWSRFQFSPIFELPRMANRPFVYLRYGKMRITVYLI